ncbi:unnamed protein product [Merluccius merluccius]
MASPDGDKDYSGPDEGMSPGQKPVPLSSGAPAGRKKACKKRKWTEPDCFNDPRVDLMQQQLGEMCKTIEYMAANQHRLLDLPCQTPLGVPPHPDAVALSASNNLDKTNSSGCGAVGQLDVLVMTMSLTPTPKWTRFVLSPVISQLDLCLHGQQQLLGFLHRRHHQRPLHWTGVWGQRAFGTWSPKAQLITCQK